MLPKHVSRPKSRHQICWLWNVHTSSSTLSKLSILLTKHPSSSSKLFSMFLTLENFRFHTLLLEWLESQKMSQEAEKVSGSKAFEKGNDGLEMVTHHLTLIHSTCSRIRILLPQRKITACNTSMSATSAIMRRARRADWPRRGTVVWLYNQHHSPPYGRLYPGAWRGSIEYNVPLELGSSWEGPTRRAQWYSSISDDASPVK